MATETEMGMAMVKEGLDTACVRHPLARDRASEWSQRIGEMRRFWFFVAV
jgi:hypothetical protein